MKAVRNVAPLLLLSTLACGQQLVDFPVGTPISAAAPTVLSTVPANLATPVALNSKVSATFSAPMDAATITTTTFTLSQAGSPVGGSVALLGATATFTPTVNLAASTTYGATIKAGVKDLTGKALVADYNWVFTTGAVIDSSPTVTSTDPANLAVHVPLNQKINALFSKAMDSTTLTSTTFTVKQGNNAVPGLLTYVAANAIATFVPTSSLAPGTTYTCTVTTGAKDLAGNPLAANFVWTFTTAAAPPQVISTNPAPGAASLCTPLSISATFDQPMDPLTLVPPNFTLASQGPTTPVNGTVSYDDLKKTATFAPTSNLLGNTTYTATVTTGAKDEASDPLAANKSWTFTTGSTQCTPPINLRGIASYGLASQAGLTSTGVTVVNGDVALYSLAKCVDSTGNAGASQNCLVKTYSSPTGLTVNGSIFFAGDPFDNGGTANSVTHDLNVAWLEGKNKTPTNGTVAGDELGGKTFNAGVYHNANLGLAANSFATLDAQNDLNAVFIFQIDSSFTDSGTLLQPTQIKLANGAQAKNVYFVAGLDVTIGSGTRWNGTILAGRTATVNNGSTVIGRVLAGATGAGALTLVGAASPSVTSITVPQ